MFHLYTCIILQSCPHMNMVIFERELQHEHWIQKAVLWVFQDLLIKLPECQPFYSEPLFFIQYSHVKLKGIKRIKYSDQINYVPQTKTQDYPLKDPEKVYTTWNNFFIKANELKISKERLVWEPSSSLPL